MINKEDFYSGLKFSGLVSAYLLTGYSLTVFKAYKDTASNLENYPLEYRIKKSNIHTDFYRHAPLDIKISELGSYIAYNKYSNN